MGHEVSHIRNYDIRISTIAVALLLDASPCFLVWLVV